MQWVQKMTARLGLDRSPRVRKLVIAVIGGTVVLFGIALLVLPGPASLVIPIGLIILASEFAWARWIVHRGKQAMDKARNAKWRKIFSSKTQS